MSHPDDDRTVEDREEPAVPPAMGAALAARLAGRRWARNLVGQAGASVYRIHAEGHRDLYLKHGRGEAAVSVADEAQRLRWLAENDGPAPAVLHAEHSAGEAWLLTSAVPGRTAHEWLTDRPSQGAQIATALADALRRLHALPVSSCPFLAGHERRLAEARRRLDAGLIDESAFDDARQGWSAQQVWHEMTGLLPLVVDPVVCHGDYSLDNILLDDQLRVTGLIDLSRLGVADRYQDLAILWNCLDEFGPEVQQRFMATYGIDEPDERKMRFHLCLDECF
ncbi:APH(3') family aminoglycoside O-phosphotransferase [Ideonella sp. DXS29W]|uniref:Aminoglycoside 3'-phosphotransferase n=1 Tax=Ideonella lacteola TaxID=2984193 RepID=A0ABU9BN79_9BURK